MGDPKANNVLVETLGSSLRYGGNALSDVPALLRQLLEKEAWRDFITRRGEHVTHERFADFVGTAPLAGLGSNVALVKRIVADDPEASDLLDRALQNPVGGDRRSADFKRLNQPLDPAAPTPRDSRSGRHLRRLRRDFPELHTEVLAGHLSAHAAAVQAGIFPQRVPVRLDDAAAAARTLRAKASPQFLAELRRLLDE